LGSDVITAQSQSHPKVAVLQKRGLTLR
ncbi:hypothetical protein CF327_g5813, partial [Tilletia walkeri]